MNGFLYINKEKDMTSRDVVNIIRGKIHERKIGHTGTLDPLATGVLILAVGSYTKLANYLLHDYKEYEAVMKLGIKTDTGDITGNIIGKKDFCVSEEDIINCFSKFPNKYLQEVPIYSAVKINGKKLYEYARENIDIKLPKREVCIDNLEFISYKDDLIKFKVRVSKGTYIRSLIEDLGKSLNTCATMNELTRTYQSNVKLSDCLRIDEVNENTKLHEIQDIFDYPTYNLNDEEYNRVINGNILHIKNSNERVLVSYHNIIEALYEKKEDNTFHILWKK